MKALHILLMSLAALLVPFAASSQEEGEQNAGDVWYEPDFNRYAVDRGWFAGGEQYGYHYEEEDEFGWYDEDFDWQTSDPTYDAWYGDADQDWQNSELWYEPDFNRYAIDYGRYGEGEGYGYHYEEEDEFDWYDEDFTWEAEDPGYDDWYADGDEGQ